MKNFIIVKLIFLALAFYITIPGNYAQNLNRVDKSSFNNNIDSLKQLYKDTLLVYKILETGKSKEGCNTSITLHWLNISDSLLQESKEKSPRLQAQITLRKARLYSRNGDLSIADSVIKRALAIYTELDDRYGISDCYYEMGMISWKKGNLVETINYAQEALRVNEQLKNKRGISDAYILIGNAHQIMGNYNESLDYYIKAKILKEELKDSMGMSRCYNNIGAAYRLLRNYDESLKYSQKSLDIKEKLKDRNGVASNLANIAGVYFENSNYSKALEYSEKALKLNLELNNVAPIATILFNISRTTYALGDLKKSRDYALKCIKQCKGSIKNPSDRMKSYFILSLIAEKEEDIKTSHYYLKKYIDLKDSVIGDEKRMMVTEMETKYQSLSNLERIEILEKEKENNALKYRRTKLILISVTSILILLMVIVYVELKSKRKLKQKSKIIEGQKDEIVKQHDELEKYKNHLESLVDEKSMKLKLALLKAEQSDNLKTSFLNNISHEIRTPMNGVMGILNYINIEKNGGLEGELKIVNNSFNQLLEFIENILLLSKLQTDQVEIKQTDISLNLLFQDLSFMLKDKIKLENKAIEVDVEIDGNPIVEYDYDLMFKLYHSIIDNAVKYTEKGKIVIGFAIRDSKCVTFVKDTGIGMDEIMYKSIFKNFHKIKNINKLYKGAGIGLTIAKKICENINAEIDVKSKKFEGTTFTVTLTQFTLGE